MDEILKAVIADASTGEIVERDFTDEEIANYNAMKAETELRYAEAEAKAAARESALAKLADLGLTAEEIAAF